MAKAMFHPKFPSAVASRSARLRGRVGKRSERRGGWVGMGVWLAVAGLVFAMRSPGAIVLTGPAPASVPGDASGQTEKLTFEQHVRPILKAHCFDCHGEGETLRGGLDLRLVRFMTRGGETGPALLPGKAEASRVYALVKSGEMPKRDRKPTAAEVEVLRRWIEGGARTLREEPEDLPAGMQITAEERMHWAFQPLRRPEVPRPRGRAAERVRNPIDAFVAVPFRTRRLGFSPEAPARTLVRRAYLDLWGMPPTPEEVEEYVGDSRPDAWERLIDRLLDSPRYGERWARHWLDVAGYADSDGYTNEDAPRPYAYKYRDYVIRALNEDRPFDRCVTEQLAGDELALTRHPTVEAAVLDPEARDWVVATGFLRMAADGTATGGVDQETARNQVVADTLKIVSTSLLGLSVGCAQCHDHRYDPIPQVDYYRLRAVFEPAYDWKQWRTPPQRLLSLYTAADREAAGRVEAEAAALAKEKEARQAQAIDEALKKHLEKYEEPLRESLWAAFKTPADQRTEEQKKLLKDHPSANINPGVLYQYNPKAADELKAMDARIAEVRKAKPAEDFVAGLWEPPGQAPVTHRFHRGDPKQAREAVAPGILTILATAGGGPGLPPVELPLPTTGRRLAFAKWVTSTNNPLLARVLVNRVWLHHFGRGLVGTPADFGMQGEPPSHPELLEWLAAAFVAPSAEGGEAASVGLGWSLKRLHRLILTSTTYRQSSAREAERERIDPENRYYWRWPMQRIDAEAVRDSFLAVSGALSDRRHGPPVPVREDVVGQVVVGIDKKEGDNKMPVEVPIGEEEFRRAIYVEVRRSKPLAFLNAFDAPVMEVNCERRQSSTVAPQALMLMNSGFAWQQARLFAARLAREVPSATGAEAGTAAGTGDGAVEARIRRAWQLAYGRMPTADELEAARVFLTAQAGRVEAARAAAAAAETAAGEPAKDKANGKAKEGESTPEELAWRGLCQALLSSNEFLYVD